MRFVSVYQPDARLRDQVGLNVWAGRYVPMAGGPDVPVALNTLLEHKAEILGPHMAHNEYETLHPFTDCNGRSGRMLWMWMMREAPLGFLHTWYYQSLDAGR